MKTAQFALISLTAVAVGAGSALADVTVIGAFTGDHFENFENISQPQSHPDGMTIFGGAAVFNDLLTNAPWITTNLSAFGQNLFPYDGFLMGLAPTGWAVFTFEEPISRFGGYIANLSENIGGSVRFLDGSGALIDELDFVPTSEWTWYGWESGVPVSTIEIRAHENPGNTLVFDNLEIAFDASPGTPGDLNGDGVVDVFDLLILLAEWGPCDAPACPADLTGDGVVDVFDLLQLLANWG